jgi:membrane-associated phospholipid phosphatase
MKLTTHPQLFALAIVEVGAVAVLLSIWTVYHRTGRSENIAGAAMAGTILLVGMALLAISSYVVAAVTPLPFYDHALEAVDRNLGFHWLPWTAWIDARPWLEKSLKVAYEAMIPELIGAVLYLGFRGEARWLLTSLFVGGAITSLVSGFVPAIGHLPNAPHVPVLLAIRHGVLLDGMPQGLVSFPSYHTTVALLLTVAFLRDRWLFPLACLLNGLMVVSTLSIGGHYLVDVLAGVLLAWISHLAATMHTHADRFPHRRG